MQRTRPILDDNVLVIEDNLIPASFVEVTTKFTDGGLTSQCAPRCHRLLRIAKMSIADNEADVPPPPQLG